MQQVTSPRARPLVHWGLAFLGALVALSGVIWLVVRYVHFNAGVVIEGQVYRSSQPSPAHIERLVRDHGVRTVVSMMRAERPVFREQELDKVQQLGAQYRWVPMPNLRAATRTELLRLIDVVETTPRPLLIHCMAGADRSGVVSAMFRMHAGAGFDEAVNEQLSLRYLHTGVFGEEIADVVRDYRAYCRETGRATGGWAAFTQWVREVYPADPYDARIEPATRELTVGPGEWHWVDVTVTNVSPVAWPDAAEHPLGLALYDHPHARERRVLEFVLLPPRLAPGASATVRVAIQATKMSPGRAELYLDLQQRDWTWFALHGSRPASLVVNLMPPAPDAQADASR